ncbi:MAG: metalloregulator ArsR/SmtB family transcription factor [Anaerolineaceae bacterium]|nr:metalloregulator ArsR/SmtB family transcription factor [Anaerolineaceae bacterium]
MSEPELIPNKINELSKWLKILGDPKRLLVLENIIKGVQCNCEMGDTLNMAPNLISHHLGILRASGLVNAERDQTDSRWIYYSINTPAMQEIRALFMDFFDPERIEPRKLTCGPQTDSASSSPSC